MANDVHKIKLLLLWDILCKNTDEDHALNTDEIANLLALRGVNVSRKILVQDIATLCDNGYEVLSYKKRYHYYYVVGGFGKTLKDGFTVTASDNYSGVTLYYKTPNSTSFVASTTSSVVFSKTAVNGTYGFYAVDGFGNRSDTCYMYMSIDAPEATIVRSDNSHKVCVIWTASNCSATLNGKSYTSGTWIEQEGEYAFIITNDANRSTTYKYTVDHYYARYSMVAPTCTQKGYTIYKCTGCGDSYDGDFIEAKGHDYEIKS